MSEAVAMPGDDDLDFDAEGVILSSAVQYGNEWIIAGAGGSGTVNGKRWTTLTEFEAVFGVWDDDPEAVAARTHRFTRWVKDAEPLRVTCAPGRLSRLCDRDGYYVILPRSAPTPSNGGSPRA